MSLGPVMLDVEGVALSLADRDLLREPAVGGVILFTRNYESPVQIADLVAEIRALHPDRPVVLGEAGWATSVHDQGEQAEMIKGMPGEAEQKVFYEAVRTWAEAEKFPVFFFEAFDENWKGGEHPNEVEKDWGLFRADRTAKAAVSQP